MNRMIWPVYEFRPLPDVFHGEVIRYADGAWLPDDGEYDLAFACPWDRKVLYVDLPYQRNIVLSWTTGHWSGYEAQHPRGNAWHYALREGASEWGGGWNRDAHPNSKAGRNGMNHVCGMTGSAAGVGIEMQPTDKHILARLVRERDSKQVLTLPLDRLCMYCGALAEVRR